MLSSILDGILSGILSSILDNILSSILDSILSGILTSTVQWSLSIKDTLVPQCMSSFQGFLQFRGNSMQYSTTLGHSMVSLI